jgi:hypothetical protein
MTTTYFAVGTVFGMVVQSVKPVQWDSLLLVACVLLVFGLWLDDQLIKRTR